MFLTNLRRRVAENSVPPDISRSFVARAVVLGLVLCLIKAMLLVDMSSHLYQTHYRLRSSLPVWLTFVNSFIFLGLLATSFIELGRQSRAYSNKDIRWCNLWFVLAGLVFVFFTLHQGQNNYLQPVLTGILQPHNIGWYLITNLFFSPPWLAVYLALYPLLYRILMVTRREGWSFYFMGGIAVLYLLLNLQEAALLGRELLLINCVGIAALVSHYRGRSIPGTRPWWWLIFLCAAGWLLFASHDASIASPEICLILIVATTLAVWASFQVLTRKSTVFPVLSHFLPFYLVTFCLLSVNYFPYSENYDHLLVYGLTLPHYFWQEILWSLALLVTSLLLSRRSTVFGRMFFDGTALVLVVVTLADLQLSRQMGFRLDWNAVTVNTDPVMLWRTIKPFVSRIVPALAGLVIAYYVGVALVRKFFSSPGSLRRSLSLNRAEKLFLLTAFTLIVCLSPVLLAKTDKAEGTWPANIVASHPLIQGRKFKRYSPEEFSRIATELGLRGVPPAPPTVPRGPERKLNVLLIVMESSYNRYLSLFGAEDETQPLLKKYRDRMELFPNFYSMFPNSFHGRFSVFAGIYPTREYVSYINPRIECPSLFEILHDRGCKVSVFDSCYGDYARLNDYLRGRKIDAAFDAYNMPGRDNFPKVSWGLSEAATMSAITNQIAEHARRSERFFLTYTPVAPHMPFDSPARQFVKFEETGRIKNDYTGRYKNQLLYLDWVITTILDSLKEQNLLEETLVIITNDHGEMVGEDGDHLGHGWSLKPVLVNTPLIIMNPLAKGYRVNPVLGGQIDVLPTVLDLLNIPVPAGELYQGVSLYDQAANTDKVLYFNSYQERAMVTGGKYFLKPAGAPATVFAVTHNGVKTSFEPTSETTNVEPRLTLFEQFQNSFIVHYPYYRKQFNDRTPAR